MTKYIIIHNIIMYNLLIVNNNIVYSYQCIKINFVSDD